MDDPDDVPTLADGVEYFSERVLSIDEERRTTVVTLGVKWTDREVAARWANELSARVNRELGTSTAVITHNLPIAAMADRVVTLADGRVQGEVVHTQRAKAADIRW